MCALYTVSGVNECVHCTPLVELMNCSMYTVGGVHECVHLTPLLELMNVRIVHRQWR